MGHDHDQLDGQLFLWDNVPPAAADRYQRTGDGGWIGSGTAFQLDPNYVNDGTQSVIYERVLLVTKDPTTPPHTKASCVKWCHVGPIKTCCGWKVQYQWFYLRAVLRVTTSVPADVKGMVEECLKQGAIAAAVAAVLTGGSAAAAAAAEAIKICLLTKLGEKLLSVSVDLEHYWGDWS